MENVDVVVLGSGGAGEWVAKHCAGGGLSVALVEAGRVGGFCPYVACVPSKSFLRSGEARRLVGSLPDLGAASAAPFLDADDLAFRTMVARRDRFAHDRDDSGAAQDVEKSGVMLVRGFGRVVEPGVVEVTGPDGTSRRLGWTDLVVATGSSPVVPDVPGLAQAPTWTSEQALATSDRPQSLLVLGGGPVGCELAQAFHRFGTEVTLVEAGEQLLGPEEPTVAAALARALTEDGVRVVLGTPLVSVTDDAGRAVCHLQDGTSVTVERVLVCVGRKPVVDGLGLELIGVEPGESGGLDLEESGQVVGQEHVWAGGDVTGCAPYTHTANYHGRVIAGNLLGRPSKLDMRAIPRAVFTEPAVASVGLDAAAAQKQGLRTWTAAVDLHEVARASFEGGPFGRLVLTLDADARVLVGAAAIGPHADSWIGEATLAIRARIPVEVLVDVVHGFPTFTEAYDLPLRELAERAYQADL